MNRLVHKVEVEAAETVDTTLQLQLALDGLVGNNDYDLADSYRIELLAETLSDGSIAYSISIRKAEAV